MPTDWHVLFSSCGVKICHRGCHRCDRVIHDCLQPTRGLCLKVDLNFCVRSVRGTPSPTTHSEGLLLRVGALPCAPTYNPGVVQHVVFNRLGFAQTQECSSKAVTCHVTHLIICTEDVTTARRTLQRLHIFSGDTTASSPSSNPKTSAN